MKIIAKFLSYLLTIQKYSRIILSKIVREVEYHSIITVS